MAAELKLKPNVAAAAQFLDALQPGGQFTFQVIREAPGMPNGAAVYHGRFAEFADLFAELNNDGFAIFVMVNEGDLKGRTTKNVVKVRAHVLDLDGPPIEPVLEADLPPQIVVGSSPFRWHAYWLVDDCPLTEFKQRQHALADRFGGDRAVCDLPRVMRLPGYYHLKGEPFMVRLVKPALE